MAGAGYEPLVFEDALDLLVAQVQWATCCMQGRSLYSLNLTFCIPGGSL